MKSPFAPYTGGIQPLQGIQEAGNAIAEMQYKSLSGLGASIAEGMKEYNKNSALSEQTNAEAESLKNRLLQTASFFEGNKEYEPLYQSLLSQAEAMAQAPTKGLPQRRAIVDEGKLALRDIGQTMQLFELSKNQKALSAINEAMGAISDDAVQTDTANLVLEGSRVGPDATLNQYKQNLRKQWESQQLEASQKAEIQGTGGLGLNLEPWESVWAKKLENLRRGVEGYKDMPKDLQATWLNLIDRNKKAVDDGTKGWQEAMRSMSKGAGLGERLSGFGAGIAKAYNAAGEEMRSAGISPTDATIEARKAAATTAPNEGPKGKVFNAPNLNKYSEEDRKQLNRYEVAVDNFYNNAKGDVVSLPNSVKVNTVNAVGSFPGGPVGPSRKTKELQNPLAPVFKSEAEMLEALKNPETSGKITQGMFNGLIDQYRQEGLGEEEIRVRIKRLALKAVRPGMETALGIGEKAVGLLPQGIPIIIDPTTGREVPQEVLAQRSLEAEEKRLDNLLEGYETDYASFLAKTGLVTAGTTLGVIGGVAGAKAIRSALQNNVRANIDKAIQEDLNEQLRYQNERVRMDSEGGGRGSSTRRAVGDLGLEGPARNVPNPVDDEGVRAQTRAEVALRKINEAKAEILKKRGYSIKIVDGVPTLVDKAGKDVSSKLSSINAEARRAANAKLGGMPTIRGMVKGTGYAMAGSILLDAVIPDDTSKHIERDIVWMTGSGREKTVAELERKKQVVDAAVQQGKDIVTFNETNIAGGNGAIAVNQSIAERNARIEQSTKTDASGIQKKPVSVEGVQMGTQAIFSRVSRVEKEMQVRKYVTETLGYTPSNFNQIMEQVLPKRAGYEPGPNGTFFLVQPDGKREQVKFGEGFTLNEGAMQGSGFGNYGVVLPNGKRSSFILPGGTAASGKFNGPKEAVADFNKELEQVDIVRRDMLELQQLLKTAGIKTADRQLVAKIATLRTGILAGIRKDYVGPGAVSDKDMEMLNNLIKEAVDAKGMFTFADSAVTQIEQIRLRMERKLQTRGQIYNVNIQFGAGSGGDRVAELGAGLRANRMQSEVNRPK